MALEDLNPAVRVEEILDGADIEPATRLEYFMKKAANEVPKPAGSADAGKVVTVNEDGDGFELSDVDPGLPEIAGVSDAGKVVTVNEDGDGYELGEIPSGLPEYTSADKGKVLTIGEGSETVQTVIVPEQTVTLQENTPIPVSGADASAFVVGATARLIASSDNIMSDKILTCEEHNGIVGFSAQGAPISFVIIDGSVVAVGTEGTWTLSLTGSAPKVEPKWEAAGGGVEPEVVYIGQRQIGNDADMAILSGEGGSKLGESACRTKIASLVGKNVIFRDGTDASHTDYAGYFAEYGSSVMCYITTSLGTPTLQRVGYVQAIH